MYDIAMESHEIFFEKLYERKWKENNLSDISSALMLSDHRFSVLFLAFFGLQLENEPISVEREYAFDRQHRIDFVVRFGSTTLFIENKISDPHYHVEEYDPFISKLGERAGHSTHKALITVSNLDDQAKAICAAHSWTILTWTDVLREINWDDPEITPMARYGFRAYLSRICEVKEVREMCLDAKTIKSLTSLNNAIENTITQSSQNASVYRTIYAASNDSYGKYFELQTSQGEIWPWFGLVFDDSSIYIEVDSDWGRLIFKKLEQLEDVNQLSTDTSEVIGLTANRRSFRTKLRCFPEKFSALDVARQEEQLRVFFDQSCSIFQHISKSTT